jgi:Kef-type K+ transport system membrane component KefB
VSSSGPLVVPEVIVAGAAFALVMVYVVRPRLARLADRSVDETALAAACVGLLVSAFITSTIGLHEIFGAFLFGAVIPRGRLTDELIAKVQPFATILLPAFFVTTGLAVDIGGIGWVGAAQLGLILAVACSGKVLGAGLAARAAGAPRREALALGVLMNTRGLTELVVLNLGRDLGVLTPRLFTLLVMMAVITTVMTGPLLDVIRPDPTFTAGDPPTSALPATSVS